MRKSLSLILAAVLCLPAAASKPTTIKVGTYNLYASISRKSIIKDPATSRQRLWKNSSAAVAGIIRDMDCDIMGLQEICDSIAGYKGDNGLPEKLAATGARYEWLLYSNYDDKNPETRSIHNSAVGIIWKAGKFKVLDKGLFWLGGDSEHAVVTDTTMLHTDRYYYKTCVWAKLKEKKSGREFYFLTAHPCVGSLSGIKGYKGRKPYPEANMMNARNLMENAEKLVPTDCPSIIVGDMNASEKSASYVKYLTTHRWKDVYDSLLSEGKLSEEDISVKGTMNDKPETTVTKARIDHIFVDGFKIEGYSVDRDKFPTADGSLHYPSDHFPVNATLSF